MAELTIDQQRALAMARARQRAQPQMPPNERIQQGHADARYPVASGSILPVTRYSDGDVEFDSNAGVVGAVRRAVELPGQAMRGEVAVSDGQGGIPDETIGRALEFGALASPANPAVRAGDRALPGVARALRQQEAPVPSAQALRDTASRQYDQMRGSGATYQASDVSQLGQTLMARLNQDGFNDVTAPSTFRTLQRLTNPPEGSFGTIDGMQSLRRALGRLRTDPTDGAAASMALRGVDEFVQAPSQSPTAAQRIAASLLGEANDNYSAAMRSREIGGIEGIAELRAAAANSGQNLGNQIRQRIASALTSRRPLRGYSSDETAALEGIVRGTPTQNATRKIGNLLGGGGGLGGITAAGFGGAAGASVAGPPGAMAGALGVGAAGRGMRAISNALTRRSLQQTDDMIRRRSPLYEQSAREMPLEPSGSVGQQAILRALLAQQLGYFQPGQVSAP